MNKLIAAVMVAGAAVVAAPALAADMPYYPPVIDVPDVDYGVQGAFYLRGSAAGNGLWAKEVSHPSGIPDTVFATDDWGFGYSVGAGVGYETGTGLRFDVTADYLANDELSTTVSGSANIANGQHKLELRSTILLANAYYDFGLGDGGYGAAGGAFGYVGAGAGVAFNDVISHGPGLPDTRGHNTSFAAAGMVGVGYDFGQVVADIGYRALYINSVENDEPLLPYSVANVWAHEVRGTLRYRFN
ncbi:putative heat resistant agglutinin 1 protein [Devosia sp. LC5]|uniref:outer membrane beta-barrel protein n=1 Tax=Devosia sp. LC5 TaxID=1502724 RepID=UPI0004E43CD2|nr:outer membrane beta-barrel protein [Devosia sp. LC5]KFC66658.1 putative heat resistant agglutinin 1 protein [Devosia sp. LC5]